MPIPFADGMLSRLGRRGAALDLIEEFEDESGEPPASLSPADLLAAEPALLLQKMENRLVRHHLANPDVLSGEQLRKLRYILNFARLADFEPGAAGPGGSRGRGDISVGGQVAPWRSRVVDALYAPLREEPDPVTALEGAKDVLATLVDDQDDQRRVLIERHGSDFSATELDAEVGYKKLVTVLGGGGGAGFVYIGGMQRLLAAGQVPDYMIGSSFGSIIGSLVARELPVPIDEYAEWAKTVSYRAILGPERRRSRHGLAGMFTLPLRPVRPYPAQPCGRRTDAHVGSGNPVRCRRRRCAQAALCGAAVQVPPSRAVYTDVAVAAVSADRYRPVGGGTHVASRGLHRLAGGQADRHQRRRRDTRRQRR